MIYSYLYQSPVGPLTLSADEHAVVGCHFEELARGEVCLTPLLKQALSELDEYFKGHRRSFSIRLDPKGTEFQRRVWRALVDIPYGQTACYQDMARAVGNNKACRAVGMANNRNPIAIFIPCHRVIGKGGQMVGYGGGVDKKIALLALERGEKEK